MRKMRCSCFTALMQSAPPTVFWLFPPPPSGPSRPLSLYIPLCPASRSICQVNWLRVDGLWFTVSSFNLGFLLILLSISWFLEIRIYRMSTKSSLIVELIDDFGLWNLMFLLPGCEIWPLPEEDSGILCCDLRDDELG